MKNSGAHTKHGGVMSPCFPHPAIIVIAIPSLLLLLPTPTPQAVTHSSSCAMVAVQLLLLLMLLMLSPSSPCHCSHHMVGVLHHACLPHLHCCPCSVFVPLPIVVAAVVMPISSPHEPWPWTLPLPCKQQFAKAVGCHHPVPPLLL
jgi:hypothetical protein